MDFKKTRIKQIKSSLETLRDRFEVLKNNDFKELEDIKILGFVQGMELIESYFESLDADDPMEVEELKAEYEEIMREYEELKKEKDTTAIIRLNTADWVEFKEKADKKGFSSSAILRKFIKEFNKNPDIFSKLV